jgi:hypothetical protein
MVFDALILNNFLMRLPWVILFTDGVAPAPRPPQARRIPLLWVFIDEKTWQAGAPPLRALGRAVFLKNSLNR